MWALRFLNGESAGREIPLQDGLYTMGRSEECQIVVSEPGVSKKHAELEVSEYGIFIVDLKSSNGTFINGVKVRESEIQPKDKVSLYQSTFDIVKSRKPVVLSPGPVLSPPGMRQAPPPSYNNAAAGNVESPADSESVKPGPLTLKNWFTNYLNTVVLPGVYKLPVWMEFKWVIACFMAGFVFIVTSLSAVPLIQILNSSVEQESMNHAESLAVTLAQMNREAVRDKMYTASSVDYALRRPGVKEALIVMAEDGRIVAPAKKAHTYSSLPFINKGRKQDKLSVEKLDSETVAAMAPIQFFNKKTNSHTARAYSAVVYDIGSLAFGNKRTVSLLVQVFFIALVLGVLLFFFLYKMIEHPVASINKQLGQALQDDSTDVHTDYDFPALKGLTDNINSALSRLSSAHEQAEAAGHSYDRMTEMNQMIQMIGYPTLGINMESRKVEDASGDFEEETGISTDRILNSSVDDIDDQALKLNITGLLDRVEQHPGEIASDSLEFSGVEFQLTAKGVYGMDSIAYILISFIPVNSGEEAG